MAAKPGRTSFQISKYLEHDELSSKENSTIVDQLAQRAGKEKYFTRIGSRCMVSIRPSRGLVIFSNSTSKEYALISKLGSKDKTLPPHAFNISASAYLHALRAKIDQSIVLLGESGSGKSNIYKVLLRNLCDLSKQSTKKSKVHSNVLKVDTILSAFGNATTANNKDSSCFTQYTEVQFDHKGNMMGAKFIEYLLEKTRIGKSLDGGKTFHVFYYLLEGATHEERMKLHLSDPAHFNYLSGSSLASFAQGKGTTPMDYLRVCLKSLGMGKRQQEQLWQLLAAILHLGNIQFVDGQSYSDSSLIKNYSQLQLVAQLLGTSPGSLQIVLTTKSRMVLCINIDWER
jgi:chitin synthase